MPEGNVIVHGVGVVAGMHNDLRDTDLGAPRCIGLYFSQHTDPRQAKQKLTKDPALTLTLDAA